MQQEKIDRAEGDQAVLNAAAENDKKVLEAAADNDQKVLEAAVANDKAIQEQLGGQIDKANQKIDTVDGELQQEKIDRAEEDQKLHGRIDQETADRIAADNALSGRIDGLDNRIDDLSGEVDEVGAISAALAGLHPLDYDGTGSKFQLSAAMGTYDGTQAMAMGGFYHFNEDVMLSLGGATTFSGEHKTAANLGVTFRVGQGGRKEKQASADVAAQIEAMQAQMQAMQEKIAALEAEKAAPAPEAAPAEETEVPAPSASYKSDFYILKQKRLRKELFFVRFSVRPIPRIRPAPVRQVQTNEKSRCCNTCFFLIFWGTTLNYLYYVMRI